MKRTSIASWTVMIVLMAATPAVADDLDIVSDDPMAPVSADVTLEDRDRGMIYDGLRESTGAGPCGTGFELEVAGRVACTHGPDPTPLGVSVTESAPLLNPEATTSAPNISCDPTDTSSYRVQAIYAVSSDKPNRFAAVLPSIGVWAGRVEKTFANSAAKYGDVRHVRWVTDGECNLDVRRVVMSPAGDDNFSNTVAAVQAAGYDRNDRKYLIWTDADVYCGIGMMYFDDRPGQENVNNGAYSMYARVDNACWGQTHSVASHELMHTLGSVQPGAPNATAYGHCTDDSDRMCYDDGPGTVVTQNCGPAHEDLFDCGGGDYFHTDPPAGSWLASHWNTADSRFLSDTDPPPVAPVLDTFTKSLSNARPYGVHHFRTSGGTVDFALVGTEQPGLDWRLRVEDAAGDAVFVRVDSRRIDHLVDLPAGDYEIIVSVGRGRYFLNVRYPPGSYEGTEVLMKQFTRTLNDDRLKAKHVFSTGGGNVDIAFVGKEVAGRTWRLIVTNAQGNVYLNEVSSRRIDEIVTLPAGTYTLTVKDGSGRYFMNVGFLARSG